MHLAVSGLYGVGLALREVIPMPANNLSVVLVRG